MAQEENTIICYLRALAEMNLSPAQKRYNMQRYKDAKPVKVEPIWQVLSGDVLCRLESEYRAKRHLCYQNAAKLLMFALDLGSNKGPEQICYVEGIVDVYGCPVEHAFVRWDGKYIDPTFELALQEDVRNYEYVSLLEMEPEALGRCLLEMQCYGPLYLHEYQKRLK